MKILAINGSSRIDSFNQRFIEFIRTEFTEFEIDFFAISSLPLFADVSMDDPTEVAHWTQAVNACDGLLIASPEYLSNIPAAIKNALEWLNKDSILAHKKVIPVICTPMSPRGEKAMQALLWSLQSLHAEILPSLSLFHNDFTSVNDSLQANPDTRELIDVCFENFKSS